MKRRKRGFSMGNQRENEIAFINALRNFFPRRKASADRGPYTRSPSPPTRVFPNPGSGFLATPIRYEFPFYRMVVETVPTTGARIYCGFTPNGTTSNVYALGVGQILECDF